MGREISLGGSLPNSDLNGWKEIVDDLVDDPTKQRVAIVVYDVPKISRNVEKGVDMPIVRIRAIEPMNDDAKATQVRLVMNDIYSERTGKKELELDYSSDEADE